MSEHISKTNGGSERFGDTPLAFGLHRFVGGGSGDDQRFKWFFSVQRYIGRDRLIELELTPADLRKMARWCERAAKDIETDGGRISQKDGPHDPAS